LSVFFWWQIICYLCGGSDRSNSVRTAGMLISLTIAIIIALLFGKVTVKEIKEYVRKRTKGTGSDCSGTEGESGRGSE
jgi:hypothetical protein